MPAFLYLDHNNPTQMNVYWSGRAGDGGVACGSDRQQVGGT